VRAQPPPSSPIRGEEGGWGEGEGASLALGRHALMGAAAGQALKEAIGREDSRIDIQYSLHSHPRSE
jgi:outer membrane lipoprotein SlyB